MSIEVENSAMAGPKCSLWKEEGWTSDQQPDTTHTILGSETTRKAKTDQSWHDVESLLLVTMDLDETQKEVQLPMKSSILNAKALTRIGTWNVWTL